MSTIPSWVYWLFLALLYIGFKNCFKRVVKVKTLIVMPLLFAWYSLSNLYHTVQISSSLILYFIIGALLGLYLGYLHVKNKKVRSDKHQHLVELPADWTVMILIFIIFGIQFALHYLLAVDKELTTHHRAMGFIVAISGLTTFIVIGRNLTYFFKFTKAPHEHLHASKGGLFK